MCFIAMLCFTSHMNELMEVSWKQFQITESWLSHREHCKDDCIPSLDGMASLSFQSFWGYTKLTHNTLERFRIKIIKPRLHAASLFWTLCTTDFIKGKPGPLKVYQTHVHFLYRCRWMQRWQPWMELVQTPLGPLNVFATMDTLETDVIVKVVIPTPR